LASGVKQDLKAKYQVEPRIRLGGGGVFEVRVDGKLLFSAKEAGRLPTPAEVVAMVGDAARPST
jgi:selT/selW/selH-like putative selenoprotein